VYFNREALRERGLYEPALLYAFMTPKINNCGWPVSRLRELLGNADRDRLRQAGADLPGAGPFTLFRGVAGRGTQRRVRGLSWTLSFEKARWFATRYDWLPQPAVYHVVIDAEDVLAYVTDRNEEEFLVWLTPDDKVIRVWTKEHGTEVNDGGTESPEGSHTAAAGRH
jgi:hypothetical protein